MKFASAVGTPGARDTLIVLEMPGVRRWWRAAAAVIAASIRVYAADSSEVGLELFSRVQVIAPKAGERKVEAARRMWVRIFGYWVCLTRIYDRSLLVVVWSIDCGKSDVGEIISCTMTGWFSVRLYVARWCKALIRSETSGRIPSVHRFTYIDEHSRGMGIRFSRRGTSRRLHISLPNGAG